jgi:predicted RNA-binding protein with RPS1 domain
MRQEPGVADPADELSDGQEVMVKCIGIDEKSGKIKLSRKALIPKPEGDAPGAAGRRNTTVLMERANQRSMVS